MSKVVLKTAGISTIYTCSVCGKRVHRCDTHCKCGEELDFSDVNQTTKPNSKIREEKI